MNKKKLRRKIQKLTSKLNDALAANDDFAVANRLHQYHTEIAYKLMNDLQNHYQSVIERLIR